MNSGSARDFLRANRRSNIHLYPDDWKKLPIPDVSAAQQKPIVALVDQILTLKRSKSAADISALETQLDAAVAKLYGLTPEEIAIVEGTAP
jgi:restriction endonuclease S subunit